MIKAVIYGASGYTGQELIRLLSRHPACEIIAVTSRRYEGQKVADLFPHLQGQCNLSFVHATPDELACLCDVAFLAVPHGISMTVAGIFLERGVKVIDLSADFRIQRADIYEAWYQVHQATDLLPQAVYGLPEIYREQIKSSRLVANPGCYPTSIILGLAPLLKGKWVDPHSIIIDSKSGVSGAGREPIVSSLFCEVGEAFKAYKAGGTHRHIPEIEQELSALAGEVVRVTFTPHLLPVSRGILSTIYLQPAKKISTEDIVSLYREFYQNAPFIRICPSNRWPNISAVRGSNFCDVGFSLDRRLNRLIVFAAIDNLIKGASGQAVQNMNLMFDLEEKTGLDLVPLYP
ncbi:MAG: N-acetyl-gamma-glutamyl-phosphate reductase [Syntrophales bacterium]|nr:N-acetyl-gamma-glutamyl-phosphate reductase [Syntrophales bacterium]